MLPFCVNTCTGIFINPEHERLVDVCTVQVNYHSQIVRVLPQSRTKCLVVLEDR